MPDEGLPERVRAERGVAEQTKERAKNTAEAQLAAEQKATEKLARREKRVWTSITACFHATLKDVCILSSNFLE
jgi:hypothetical protein